MSAEMAVRAAVIAALRADAALTTLANDVYDGEPARAAAPYVFAGECVGADWGGKDVEGREVRVTIGLAAAGEPGEQLSGMMARVDPALGALAPVDGWRVVSARLARSRVARAGPAPAGGWRAVMDYRLRAVREG